ncbi:MAG: GIY-YIG nuclease family protein [Candidatus Doudnabacteria bacterium]|nr:GIY-YIG nuclease family protein [bacterium]MDZ4243755.1 GIY-YIG nuclease family protein [Candidatus Doudnabacteria bacterium]
MLESKKNGGVYIGLTAKSLKSRVQEHNSGLSSYTKKYKPWQLIHFEGYLNKSDAARREQYLKSNKGARVLKLMLKEYFQTK